MEYVGTADHGQYAEALWCERDNFATVDGARDYAIALVNCYPVTPYRIVERDARYHVEFVPAWELRGERSETGIPCTICGRPTILGSSHGIAATWCRSCDGVE